MTRSFELKKLGADSVPAAIRRAEHYRLLNDPTQAESICLDVLQADPDNEQALITLILAITDQFSTGGSATVARARGYVHKLSREYDRAYYQGIVAEREGRAFLGRGAARSEAYTSFVEAMDWYEKASELQQTGGHDPVLRWNSCARTLMHERLEPPTRPSELPLE